ncbi:MAG: hypothetical protein EXQ95_08635, partial [Alphaproteobacteria bacterium]|nr:hypothetical protein [Alphaproteobacteria bacterium]
MEERTLEQIAEALENRHAPRPGCALFIGAGCSLAAGIPLAAHFIGEIRKKYPSAYAGAPEKTYAGCMSMLTPNDRRTILGSYIDAAKINWAHIAIAQLIESGRVDRVLTTNFDPLVSRSCALVGEFPAVYDLAMSTEYRSEHVASKAIIHLHGQRTGFALMHTGDEIKSHLKVVTPVVDDALNGRPLVVIGYSGEDPTFEALASRTGFDNGLYWVSHKGKLADRVRQCLDASDRWRHAYHVAGNGADEFLIRLAQLLNCFPPELIGRPFSYLRGQLDRLSAFHLPGEARPYDLLTEALGRIDEAAKTHEAPKKEDGRSGAHRNVALEAQSLLSAGRYDEVIALVAAAASTTRLALTPILAWAYVLSGNTLTARARSKSDAEADALFKDAYAKYAEAVRIKPDKHEAFYNWGTALSEQAKTKSGAEADALLKDASAKYAEAVRIEPEMHEAFSNWGIALSDQAKTKSGAEADALLKDASAK